jgi:hypothetical protein
MVLATFKARRSIMSDQNSIPLERPKRLSEILGLWMGSALAPAAAIGSALRGRRAFHPRGIYFRAEVDPSPDQGSPFVDLANGLAQGPALVRLSPGLYTSTQGTLPDVLGCAIRFNMDPNAPLDDSEAAQDVLLVTSQSVMMLPIAALLTNQRDFLANVYYGMSKFELPGQPNIALRLVPLSKSPQSNADRFTKIRQAVADNNAVYRLDARVIGQSNQWTPVVTIYLQMELPLDDRKTAYWPFLTGQDLRPQGFVQYLRPLPYLSSQWARGI